MKHPNSIKAYKAALKSGLIKGKRKLVYDMLYQYGPLTTNELLQKMTISKNNNHNVHTRLSELRSMGAVAEVGTKKCSITNMTVILWDVTQNLPTKLQTRKSFKSLYEELVEIITVNKNLKAEEFKDKVLAGLNQ